MVRSILGVVVGAVVWTLGFYALVILLSLVWHDFSAHGRVWLQHDQFTFTAPMAVCMLIFWALADVLAGWTVAKIARQRAALWVLAGLIFVYLATIHLLLRWSDFPWWYDLGVVLPAAPAVLLGGRLAR